MQSDEKEFGKISWLVNKHYRTQEPINTIGSDACNKAPLANSPSLIQPANACLPEKLTAVIKQDNEADGSDEGDAKLAMKNLQQSGFELNHSATRS